MTLFDEAEALVNGDRQEEYGPPAENLANIAASWTAILKAPITAQQVCLCMASLKLVRAGSATSRDSLVDACGYLRLHEMCGSAAHNDPPDDRDARDAPPDGRCHACKSTYAARCGRFIGDYAHPELRSLPCEMGRVCV